MRRPRAVATAVAFSFASAACAAQGQPGAPSGNGADLSELPIEALGRIPVISVTGRPQQVQDAAASVFVITAEDIRRSAATTLPEALRLAPNLEVARISATAYAISARGFNNAIGNKLLVMIDGRTIYSPLFSGVFWDAQAVMLEDVERIEVISGAGATLWGANAVNGVINIITRSAAATEGLLAVARGGDSGNAVSLRYGAGFGDHGAWRAYAMHLDEGSTALAGDVSQGDGSQRDQAGFRMDWTRASEHVTVQGDAYQGGGNGALPDAARVSGGNLLARWYVQRASGANWRLQAYVDEARRDDDVEIHDRMRVTDVQFNNAPHWSERHEFLWGVGYRRADDATRPTAIVLFQPGDRVLHWANVFAQDEMHVTDTLHVLAGAKIETNIYTGAELLPTLRATWNARAGSTLWASASRAVRAPARFDRDLFIPGAPPFIIDGGPTFRSEVADVYEIGLKSQRGPDIGWSATAFYDNYERLRAGTSVLPTTVDNLAWGHVAGVEAWGDVDLTRDWRLSAGAVAQRETLKASPLAGPGSVANLGDDPTLQWSLRSRSRLARDIDFDIALRHVAHLPDPAVRSYTAADVRLAWRMRPGLDVSLLGRDLGSHHVEFDPATSSRFGPRAFIKLEWRGV